MKCTDICSPLQQTSGLSTKPLVLWQLDAGRSVTALGMVLCWVIACYHRQQQPQELNILHGLCAWFLSLLLSSPQPSSVTVPRLWPSEGWGSAPGWPQSWKPKASLAASSADAKWVKSFSFVPASLKVALIGCWAESAGVGKESFLVSVVGSCLGRRWITLTRVQSATVEGAHIWVLHWVMAEFSELRSDCRIISS